MAGPALRGVRGHSQATPIVREPPQAQGMETFPGSRATEASADCSKYLLAVNSDRNSPSCFDGKKTEVDPPRNVPITGCEMINLIQHVTSYFPLARKLFVPIQQSCPLGTVPFLLAQVFPTGLQQPRVAAV